MFNSLGSTRFFKVARARTREGLVVVKVFAVHDPSLPLAEHKERILKIKEQLASAFNCLPFQRVIVSYYINSMLPYIFILFNASNDNRHLKMDCFGSK